MTIKFFMLAPYEISRPDARMVRDVAVPAIVEIKPPKKLLKFIAEKGSVSINGVSLTVNSIKNDKFKVNIIPFTLKETNLGALVKGNEINIEIDLIARYLENIIKRK